ncbi:hypothetical protein FWP33_18700 [Vibrio parahaemolyticus]|nr:hypothetical protein [Vibrio parahaemolyticus]EJE4724647.1 hypothetical protein [Vibrio parahaemolyticus]EJO2026010.1 hypothetical protein [Vibrio parahaemolyticus]
MTNNLKSKSYQQGNTLKPVKVYYPDTNLREAALLDEDNKLVGLEPGKVYHPAGGTLATNQIADADPALVVGSQYWQIDCRHCHGNIYMLA